MPENAPENVLKQAYTDATEDGIYHYPVKADGSAWLAPIRLSELFTVVGCGRDTAGKNYYIISYGNGHCLIARGKVGTSEGWETLRNHIDIPSAKKKTDLLTEYIQGCKGGDIWQITDKAGWFGDAYILPSGEIIGKADKVFFNGRIDNNKRQAYRDHGSLSDWKSQIGNYAAGNSRICLLLGAAFAAPLMGALGLDGGVLHVYGDSSAGKTTALRIAQSVWGHGKDAANSWNTTALALVNNATGRHDGLLAMDELGTDKDGKGIDSVYDLANGKNRSQADAEGGNRPELTFRVFCISNGEVTLEDHMRSTGKIVKAGQMVRCPSVAFKLENYHGYADGNDFVNHLRDAVQQYYGTAGREYIKAIVENKQYWMESAVGIYQKYCASLTDSFDLNPQTKRTATLFAAAMTGLHMAIKLGVLAIDSDAAILGIRQCFSDWLDASGTPEVSFENDNILRHCMDFVQMQDLFFADPEKRTYPVQNFPGYAKRQTDYPEKDDEYYIFPAVFKDQLCRNFNEAKVREVLHEAGWLEKHEDKRWLFQLYGLDPQSGKRKRLGRFYKLKGIAPPE